MTNKELQTILATYPDEIEIVVYGYESGCNSLNEITQTKIYLRGEADQNWWDGEHQFTHEYKDDNKIETDVLLFGPHTNPNVGRF